MKSKKKLLKKSLLYLILDRKQAGSSFSLYSIARKIKDSDIDIIQFRDKISKKEIIIRDVFTLRKLLSGSKAIFIVNDYLDIAKIVDSDGVHLGQQDMSLKVARKVLGPDKIIGISCHNLKQAFAAEKGGADYIGIGPLFPTPTKPEYKAIGLKTIKKLKNKIKIPFFVIGDINLSNIEKVVSSGARRVAVCRAILNARNIPFAVRRFSTVLHQ